MNVKHLKFLVEYADDPAAIPRVVEVRVIMADRLAVEFHGRKYGLHDPAAQPQLTGFLWLYYAMIRQGDVPADLEFKEFEQRCLDNTKLDEVVVPPTSESDGSASGSPSVGPESTGSTPSPAATTS